jgi:hypothetical protein
LAERDANANDLTSSFDFTQPPRQAEFIGTERNLEVVDKKNPVSVIYLTYGGVLSVFVIAGIFMGLNIRKKRINSTSKVDK